MALTRHDINSRLRDVRDTLDARTDQEAVYGPCADLPDVLAAVRYARSVLDSVEALSVTTMRSEGASWQDIGAALNITRQAAQQRYGKWAASSAGLLT